MARRVAVVTGGNKGIGFETVRGLIKQAGAELDVVLTARDDSRGKEAIAKLAAEGLDAKFHQCDITDESSVTALRDFLLASYGGSFRLLAAQRCASSLNSALQAWMCW